MSRFSSRALVVPVLLSVIVAAAAGFAGQAYAATTSTTTQRWQDFAPGKVVQVGATNYVKVADDQWLAMENPLCNDPVLLYPGSSKSFSYTGDAQSYTFYQNCQYRVELWGASGGKSTSGNGAGYGAYVAGGLSIKTQIPLYIYVGQKGVTTNNTGAWNGGGPKGTEAADGSGGGGSDIRTVNGDWSSDEGLRSRIAAAGAGGGDDDCRPHSPLGGNAGGLIGPSANPAAFPTIDPASIVFSPATQTQAGIVGRINASDYPTSYGAFGRGAPSPINALAGGGGGWYGGSNSDTHSMGGSSYISGHTGCVAVTSTSDSTPKSGCTTGTTDNSCSVSPYGYTFTNTVMIDGSGYAWTNVKGALQAMPNPAGGYYASGVGHTGNGAARITRLN